MLVNLIQRLVGRLQSGQLDVGFFYSTETSDAKIPAIVLPTAAAPKASYIMTILRDAPNPTGAEQFLTFLLGPEGQDLVKQHGLTVQKPTLTGDASRVLAKVRALVEMAK